MGDINAFLEKEFQFINKNNVIDNDDNINNDNLKTNELYSTLQENMNSFEKISFNNYFKIDYLTINGIMKDIPLKEHFYLYKENISVSEEYITQQIQNVKNNVQQKIDKFKRNIIILLNDENTLKNELSKLDETKLIDELNQLNNDLQIKMNNNASDLFDQLKLDNDIDTIQKKINTLKTNIDDIPLQKNKINIEIEKNSNNIIQNYKHLNIYNSFPVNEYLDYLMIEQQKYETKKIDELLFKCYMSLFKCYILFNVFIVFNLYFF